MEISPKPGRELRSKIGRIATAIAFAFVICSVAVGPARADDRRGHDDRGGDRHHDNRDRGERGPNVYYAPQPDYYYAPPPNYYNSPEPDYYYAPQPEYHPPPPGIRLFFGF
jgi:uncharacterized protein DUF3824